MSSSRSSDPRDFGHIYLRGTTYWIRFRVGGKEYRESADTTSLPKAERRLGQRAGELGAGTYVAPSARRLTFEALAECIRADYRLHDRRSADRLEDSLKRLEEIVEHQRAQRGDRLRR